jgi:hypothetical protein
LAASDGEFASKSLREVALMASVSPASCPLIGLDGGSAYRHYRVLPKNISCLTGYQLQSGSPDIGTGISIASPGTMNLFGIAIPNGTGSGYNIGAY